MWNQHNVISRIAIFPGNAFREILQLFSGRYHRRIPNRSCRITSDYIFPIYCNGYHCECEAWMMSFVWHNAVGLVFLQDQRRNINFAECHLRYVHGSEGWLLFLYERLVVHVHSCFSNMHRCYDGFSLHSRYRISFKLNLLNFVLSGHNCWEFSLGFFPWKVVWVSGRVCGWTEWLENLRRWKTCQE